MSREIRHTEQKPTIPQSAPAIFGTIKREPLTQQDYQAMKGYLPKYWHLLLFKTLRATGLRINELLRTQRQHVRDDGVNLGILIRRGKRRLAHGDEPKWEWVHLPAELAIELRAFVNGNGLGPEDRVFPISDRYFRTLVRRAGEKAIGRAVHPHELRGLYIREMRAAGYEMDAVAKIVGHRDVRTTLNYYYDLTADERREMQRSVQV